MTTPTLRVDVENGKYTVLQHATGLVVLRHGKDWRDVTGDKLILALAQEVESLRAALAREPEPPRPPLCPDCGQPMAQARQGEDVYLCANLDCVPRPPTRLLVSREWLRARIMSDPETHIKEVAAFQAGSTALPQGTP